MVQTGRVLFDSSCVTAQIIDENNETYFVPIKNVIGSYFLAEINKQIYVFTLKGARILTKRQTATRTFRYILYETSHYRSISPQDNKELELVLEKNQLPKVNLLLFSVLKELGRREKGTKKGRWDKLDNPHQLKSLIEETSNNETRYTEQVKNIKEYLEHLKVEEIVTPVQKMANFLDEDLIQTDPAFYGEVISRFKRTDTEHKIIMNKPIGTKKHWFKWIAVMMLIGLVIGAGILLLGGGNFQAPNLGNMIPGFNLQAPGQLSLTDFQKVYPTPEAAKLAVDNGQLTYDQIPQQLRDLVKNTKLPTVTPIPPPVENKVIELTP